MMSPVVPLIGFRFASPWMLGWLAALALPVLIHLWYRRQRAAHDWAATRLLLAAITKRGRRLKVSQWLLLALRMLLIACVAVAVAQPLRRGGEPVRATGRPSHHILLVDGSASMDYRPAPGGPSRFERAKELAAAMVAQGRGGDSFSLVLMADRPRTLVRGPEFDLEAVAQQVAALRRLDTSADLPAALAEVERLLAAAAGQHPRRARSEITLFSDLDATTWNVAVAPGDQGRACRASLDRLAQQARLNVVDVGQTKTENISIVRLGAPASLGTLNRPIPITADIVNRASRSYADRPVELYVDGQLADQAVIGLAPRGRQSVRFSHTFTRPGDHVIEVRLGDDPLPLDNRRYLVLRLEQAVRVLCVGSTPRATHYLALALDPQQSSSSPIQPVEIDASELGETDLASFDSIVFSDVGRFTEREAEQLKRYLVSGGTALFFLGREVQPSQYERLRTGQGRGVLPVRLMAIAPEGDYHFDPLAYRHPALEAFRGRDRAGLLTTPIRRYWRMEVLEPAGVSQQGRGAVEPAAAAGEARPPRVVLGLSSGDPAIVEGRVGLGRSIVVAVPASFDPRDDVTSAPWTALPVWPSFLPLVRELLAHMVAATRPPSTLVAGTPIGGPLAADGMRGGAFATVHTPRQRVVRVPIRSHGGRRSWSFGETDSSGIYRVDVPGRGHEGQCFAVNVPPQEGALQRIDARALPSTLRVLDRWQRFDRTVDAPLPAGRPIGRWLIAGALLLALLDPLLGLIVRRRANGGVERRARRGGGAVHGTRGGAGGGRVRPGAAPGAATARTHGQRRWAGLRARWRRRGAPDQEDVTDSRRATAGIHTGALIAVASPASPVDWTIRWSPPAPPFAMLMLIVLSLAVVIACYWADHPTRDGRSRRWAAAMRVLAVAWLLGMLAQPMWHGQRTAPPVLAVLVDRSASMATADAEAAGREGAPRQGDAPGTEAGERGAATGRLEQAKHLLVGPHGLLRALAGRYRTAVYTVGDRVERLAGTDAEVRARLRALEATDNASRIGAALERIGADWRTARPAAVLLLSDGINTDDRPLSDYAVGLAQRNIPLYTIGTGSETPPTDVRLLDVLVDELAYLGDPVLFRVTIAADRLAGKRVTIHLRADRDPTVLATATVQLPAGNHPVFAQLMHRPRQPGRIAYHVSVDPVEGEADTGNNRLTRVVRVAERTVRVLLVGGTPSYEFRFLKNALEREPTIALRTVLQEADPEYVQLDRTALGRFPQQRDALFGYDVVVLGDADPELIGRQAMLHLRDFVQQEGGGLVAIAGPRYMPARYAGTPIAPLLPIHIETARLPAPGQHAEPCFIVPTKIGLGTPSMQLGTTPQATANMWSSFPPCYWLLEAADLKPGARVLARRSATRASVPPGHRGGSPLIISQYSGSGIVRFHAIDATWRWRRGVGDVYFGRYWIQTLRALARGRLATGGARVALVADRSRYETDQPVHLRARFFDARLAPAAEDRIVVAVQAAGGPVRRQVLRRVEGDQRRFEGEIAGLAEGVYRAWIVQPALAEAPPSTDFMVANASREFRSAAMAAGDLKAAAAITGGRMYRTATVERLVADLPAGKRQLVETVPPTPIWNRPWIVGTLFFLLGTEWILRRRLGLW